MLLSSVAIGNSTINFNEPGLLYLNIFAREGRQRANAFDGHAIRMSHYHKNLKLNRQANMVDLYLLMGLETKLII